ncbi:MAG: hypothetical protein HYU59_12010 [Magnetospirillum gryphiswaldense]|uniref:hypothetical protein n=1 Tax=Magnetospirillum sp. 64-120 TaxID=1895778 RepID=UPI0025C6CB4B|nr:hypothetical protein [Magnetospirillum sp. 64-120]MBI2241511.1 hypothetical protein [Magnetospirillum gryphiswaldense]
MATAPADRIIRLLALGALYGAAVAIAVVFSPANGFLPPEKLNNLIGMNAETPVKLSR